eukprot:844231-Prymnesium_polylepis.1
MAAPTGVEAKGAYGRRLRAPVGVKPKGPYGWSALQGSLLYLCPAAAAQPLPRCSRSSLGVRPPNMAGGEDGLEWRELFKQCIELNLWSCLADDRLHVLQQRAATSSIVAAAEATGHVGNVLTRILVLLGRGEEAARAAVTTLRACRKLGVAESEVAAHALHQLGDIHLDLGQLDAAQKLLKRALRTFGTPWRGFEPRPVLLCVRILCASAGIRAAVRVGRHHLGVDALGGGRRRLVGRAVVARLLRAHCAQTRSDHRSKGPDHRSKGPDHRSKGPDHRSIGCT